MLAAHSEVEADFHFFCLCVDSSARESCHLIAEVVYFALVQEFRETSPLQSLILLSRQIFQSELEGVMQEIGHLAFNLV